MVLYSCFIKSVVIRELKGGSHGSYFFHKTQPFVELCKCQYGPILHFVFMPPTSKKLEGHIGTGLFVCSPHFLVCFITLEWFNCLKVFTLIFFM